MEHNLKSEELIIDCSKDCEELGIVTKASLIDQLRKISNLLVIDYLENTLSY